MKYFIDFTNFICCIDYFSKSSFIRDDYRRLEDYKPTTGMELINGKNFDEIKNETKNKKFSLLNITFTMKNKIENIEHSFCIPWGVYNIITQKIEELRIEIEKEVETLQESYYSYLE